MKNNPKIISIDFDGVIIAPFLNPSFLNSSPAKPKNHPYYLIEYFWQSFNILFQKPYPLVSQTLHNWHSQGVALHLTTSRRPTLRQITTQWLKKHHLYSSFSQICFNENYLDPWKHKENEINKHHFSIHIEDDYNTIAYLSPRCPHTHFYFFNHSTRKFSAPNVTTITSWKDIQNI